MRCGFVGHPASHSLSPALHLAAYGELGLTDWRYESYDVLPGELSDFITGCAIDGNWRGLSVSMPHKNQLLQFGVADQLASLVGAGNTIIFPKQGSAEPAKIYNTDVLGFQGALAEAGVDQISTAAIVGNGATAQSALVGIATKYGLSTVRVYCRDFSRAEAIVSLGEKIDCAVELAKIPTPETVSTGSTTPESASSAVELVVSTVPAAGVDHCSDWFVNLADVVFDCIYDPWPTKLAEAADRSAKKVLSGLDLLVHQGVKQVELMTGQTVSPNLLRRAGLTELAARGK